MQIISDNNRPLILFCNQIGKVTYLVKVQIWVLKMEPGCKALAHSLMLMLVSWVNWRLLGGVDEGY